MKKNIKNLSLLILITTSLLLFSGYVEKNEVVKPASENEAILMAILWQQNSAEYRALAYQAFNVAKIRIDEELKINRDLKRAVVVDLDETVIDNSQYDARAITNNENYPEGWSEWCNMAQAKAVPGAKEFLDYAVSKGFDVFYLSNRKTKFLDVSMKNLEALGFPQVEASHFYLRDKINTKEGRRQTIAKTHYIALLVGDNLNDFAKVFENKSIKERFAETDEYKEDFGRKFIVLPNPMYGEWENALYDYNKNISIKERDQKRLSHLKSY